MKEILKNVRSGRRASLKTYRPDLPAEIIAMVDRATAHKPANRYQKAEELKVDLDCALKDLLDSGQVGGAKQGSSRRFPGRPNASPIAVTAAVIAVIIGAVAVIGLTDLPGAGDPDPVVTELQPSQSEAKTLLDSGDYEGAVTKSREALQANPADAVSKYILGYALLFGGDLEEAEATFAALEKPKRRQEGLAALAHARYDKNPAGLAAILDATEARSGYMSVLKATHEFLDEDFEQAALTLTPVTDMSLFFDWQREKRLQLLGRAYLALGKLDAAGTTFRTLESLQRKSSAGMAQAYIQIVSNRMDESRRESVRKQLDRIVEARKENDDEQDRDLWSSRPMRVWIMPSVTRRSRFAVESGLADIMPFLLANSLTKRQQPPIEVVERDILLDILMEQDLSAKLSDGPDAIALGKVLAARLALVCNFNVLMGGEYLAVKLSDTATTRAIPLSTFNLERGVNPDEWVDSIASVILDAISEEYPIRGMVTASGSETHLNVGAAVGVEAGMRFKVMQAAGSGTYPDSFAVAEGEPEASRTRVSLEGLDPGDIPEAGLYVEAIPSQPSESESNAS
jgi:tetratricopeptide (TPR) repeat protein